MNLKKNFRAVLTTLGIGSLVYAAILFSSTSGSNQDVKSLIIYGILELSSSHRVCLVRTTKDEA
jgi:hypothetical protein